MDSDPPNNKSASIVTWPVRWIDDTFTSKAKTEALLRPELDNSLRQGDFEKAVDFFSGSQRHLPVVCTIVASSIVSGYGLVIRKPRWTVTRATFLGGLAAIGGSSIGQAIRVYAHAKFIHSLEDRNGFLKSLSNVNTRLGSAGSTKLSIGGVRGQETIGVTDANQAFSELTSPDSATTVPNQIWPHARWDDIRTANARNVGRNSSWDALRQKHEWDRVAGTEEASFWTENDRTQEQARFDAMVEEERKRAS